MVRDRQLFDTHILENGARHYHYHDPNSVTAELRMIVPVGHVNNVQPYQNGSAHFLEHVILRSKTGTNQSESLDDRIVEIGGSIDAWTDLYTTTFSISIPSTRFRNALDILSSHIANMTINKCDIDNERDVILAEMISGGMFYPARSEVDQYLRSYWMHDIAVTLSQRLGDRNAIREMSTENLKNMYASYFRLPFYVVSAGDIDIGPIQDFMKKLAISSDQLISHEQELGWVRKDHHQMAFGSVSQPTYFIGGFYHGLPDRATYVAINFIVMSLENLAHSPLMKWLRRDLGWTYYVRPKLAARHKGISWIVEIPLIDERQVESVRSEIENRLRLTMRDSSWLKKEVLRRTHTSLFTLETQRQIVDAAVCDLSLWRSILTEEAWQTMIRACEDPVIVSDVLEKLLSNRGELTLLPRRRMQK